MNTPECRKLIGKEVCWDVTLDVNRGTYKTRYGTVDEVKGKNIMIDGDWKWLPKMTNLRLKGTPSPWEKE